MTLPRLEDLRADTHLAVGGNHFQTGRHSLERRMTLGMSGFPLLKLSQASCGEVRQAGELFLKLGDFVPASVSMGGFVAEPGVAFGSFQLDGVGDGEFVLEAGSADPFCGLALGRFGTDRSHPGAIARDRRLGDRDLLRRQRTFQRLEFGTHRPNALVGLNPRGEALASHVGRVNLRSLLLLQDRPLPRANLQGLLLPFQLAQVECRRLKSARAVFQRYSGGLELLQASLRTCEFLPGER
jgi:hypothetical protein